MRLIVPLACVAVLACRDVGPEGAHRTEVTSPSLRSIVAANESDTALRLIAFAPMDTLRDPASLRVVVVIRNGGAYRELGDTFYSFSYEVIDSSGAPLRPAPLPQVYGVRRVFHLGRGEFAGFTERLACQSQPTERKRDCWWDFRLPAPGAYRIVAHYRTYPPPDVSAPVVGRDYLALSSDTLRIEFFPRLTR